MLRVNSENKNNQDFLTYKNKITGEIFFSNINPRITVIDGKDFIHVFDDQKKRTVKMLKDALIRIEQ